MCPVSGKEMCSDAFPAEDVEEAPGLVKVQSRLMTEGGEEINIGGNASAEEAAEQLDDSVKTVDAVEYTFKLQPLTMSKGTLKTWLKTYMQAIRKKKKDAGVPQEEIKAFMEKAPVMAKFLMGKIDEFEVFINEDFNDAGCVTFREWSEKGNIYYYIKDGLDFQRC